MTPDQPAAPAGLHPETAVICAGRPGHAARRAAQRPRGAGIELPCQRRPRRARRTAAPTRAPTPRRAGRRSRQPWARWRAVTPWPSPPAWPPSPRCSTSCPPARRIVAPADCYFGVGELLADARQQGRWAVDRVDLTDTAAVQAAVDGGGPALAGDPLEPAARGGRPSRAVRRRPPRRGHRRRRQHLRHAAAATAPGPGAAAGGAQGGKVGYVKQRIRGGLQPEQVRTGDGGLDARGVGQVNAVNGPAALLLAVGQELADPEIAVGRGNDAGAGRYEVEHGSDRGHAGGESHGVAALHLAHGCLQGLPGRRGVRA